MTVAVAFNTSSQSLHRTVASDPNRKHITVNWLGHKPKQSTISENFDTQKISEFDKMTSPSNFISPIPTKSYEPNLINTMVPSPRTKEKKVPALEELIDLCYRLNSKVIANNHYTINHDNLDYDELLVYQFERFVIELHCQENLRFLIEIFKYEHLYDSIFPDNDNLRLNTPSPKPPAFSNSLNALNGRLSREVTPVGSLSHAPNGLSRAGSFKSINTVDNEPALVFALTIDDLNDVKEANTNIWDELMERELHNHEVDLESSDEEVESSIVNGNGGAVPLDKNLFYSPKLVEEREKLTRQWDHIIRRYIMEDASEQINLSNNAYAEIMNENESVTNYHTPNALWRAKNEVLQLIKENAYVSFCKKIQKKDPSERCEALGIQCRPGSCAQEGGKAIHPSLTPLINGNESDIDTPLPKTVTSAMRSAINTPLSRSPQHSSPAITPVSSNSGLNHSDSLKVRNKGKAQGRLRQFASPITTSLSSSGSASPSSLSAFLGHLKINSGSGGSTTSTNELHGTESISASQNSSMSTSPVLIKKTLTNELQAEETGKRKLRLWKNKHSK